MLRGQLPVKWRDRMQEYVWKKGEGSMRNLEQAKGECLDGEMKTLPWSSPCDSSYEKALKIND